MNCGNRTDQASNGNGLTESQRLKQIAFDKLNGLNIIQLFFDGLKNGIEFGVIKR